MFVEKQKILQYAPNMLNSQNQPWYVTAEGNALVARWKWMDATFFSPHEATNETKAYTFIVTLSDDGTWQERDITSEKSADFGPGGMRMQKKTFIGKTTQKSFTFGLGKDNQTGQTGMLQFKFDTTLVKQSIRSYLMNNGWQKAGVF